MSTFLESGRARAISLPIVVIGNVLILEYGYTIASQAISDHTTALQVARKPCGDADTDAVLSYTCTFDGGLQHLSHCAHMFKARSQ